ncbi:DUF397 domain-containing protein [Streptomyces sp. NPDC020412]|uniref:DUF397 domain-containing protein n=1 Tax=Streptomyces sp. NPDC020412 TaxID=3365073 RepID=UPI00378DC0C6
MNRTDVPVWRKSSYSGNEDNCVEFADNLPEAVPVRDSKNPTGPALAFGVPAWGDFVEMIKREG